MEDPCQRWEDLQKRITEERHAVLEGFDQERKEVTAMMEALLDFDNPEPHKKAFNSLIK